MVRRRDDPGRRVGRRRDCVRADGRRSVQRSGRPADGPVRQHAGLVLAPDPVHSQRLLRGEPEVERHDRDQRGDPRARRRVPLRRQARVARRLQPVCRRAHLPRVDVARAQQRRPGPVGPAGTPDHEDVPRHGPAGAAHGAGGALRQQRLPGAVHRDRGDRRGLPLEGVRGEHGAPVRVPLVGLLPLRVPRQRPRAVRRAVRAQDARDRVDGSPVPAGGGDGPRDQ